MEPSLTINLGETYSTEPAPDGEIFAWADSYRAQTEYKHANGFEALEGARKKFAALVLEKLGAALETLKPPAP